jgi:4'-phosphopantetheinyl transferase
VRLDAAPSTFERSCDRLLDAGERARLARLRHPARRREFVVARALVRTLLSRWAPVAPAAWRFDAGPHGRPEIAGPAEASRLRFNVSHTRYVVGCAVTVEQEVGLDLEDTRRPRRVLDLAVRHFAPAEVATIRALAEPARTARFFDVWTLKESYLKARGLGLRLPLRHFAFDVAGDGEVQATFDSVLRDDGTGWHFALRETPPAHRLALAVRRAGDAPLRLIVEDVTRVAPDGTRA